MGCWLGEGWSGGRVPLVVKGNQVAGSQTSSDEQSIDNHEDDDQGCIFRLTCSHRELTEDHALTSVYVKIFRTVTRNAVNKSV